GNATDEGKWHVEQHQAGILEVTEQDKQNEEDERQRDGHHLRQALRGAALVLEVAGPFHAVSFGQLYHFIHLGLRLGDGRP
nr:hypothetical protein [Tanacetum cinerariifolium]